MLGCDVFGAASCPAHVKGIRRRASKLIAPSLHTAEAVSQFSAGQLCQIAIISFDSEVLALDSWSRALPCSFCWRHWTRLTLRIRSAWTLVLAVARLDHARRSVVCGSPCFPSPASHVAREPTAGAEATPTCEFV